MADMALSATVVPSENDGSSTSSEKVYDHVCARWQHADGLQWQVPSVGLAAQAFLFTIELGGSSTTEARIIAAVLSIVLNAITIQLMTRHRRSCVYYSKWIERFEREHFGCDDAHPHAFNNDAHPAGGWSGGTSSYRVWLSALPTMGIASAAIIVIAGVRPTLL